MAITNSASYLDDMLNMDDDQVDDSEELRDIARFSKKKAAMSSANYLDEMISMEEEPKNSTPSEVSEFFKGKNVFITGGSGYVGCILIEKLLRGCKGIGKLYLLARSKKGKTAEERFKKLFSNCLYDQVKDEQPGIMDRIVIVEGDTGQPDLGLSPEDRKLLVDNVHVVFHSAATTRFNEPLKRAVHINVRGVKLVVELAKEMRQLEALVHISTAFVNCQNKYLDEQFYKPYPDVGNILSLVDFLDDESLAQLTPKLIGSWVNTYAFSKALGEEVVRRYGSGLPICVVRPSIMLQTYQEPLHGWSNTVIGLSGVIAGLSVCLLHALLVDLSKNLECVPADYVINQIIVAAWDSSKTMRLKRSITHRSNDEMMEPPIYNCVSSVQKPVKWGEKLALGYKVGLDVPNAKVICYFFVWTSKYYWLFVFQEILFHFIPALITDGVLRLIGRKPMLFNIYKKVHEAFDYLSYFTLNEWTFNNDNTMKLLQRMNSKDKEKFEFDFRLLNWEDYIFYQGRGVRKYILKESSENIPYARQRYAKIVLIFWTVVTVITLLFVKLVTSTFFS